MFAAVLLLLGVLGVLFGSGEASWPVEAPRPVVLSRPIVYSRPVVPTMPVVVAEGLGTLQGSVKYTEDGMPYYAFQSIPYAEPPVGKLRFKAPVAKAPVSTYTIVNASVQPPACLQYNRSPAPTGVLEGEEDCLFINIFTPACVCQSASYPILAFVYGGAFTYGDVFADTSRLVARGIVVVQFSYRLGVLGFLGSGDAELPGNFGMLDQQMALQWIQDNIHHFCGDRHSVTIAGPSAGGSSVALHLLSPGSRGLFHRAICVSGVATNAWVEHTGGHDQVRALASYVGCCASDDQPIPALVECMRCINASVLVEAQTNFQGFQQQPFSPFGPVVDGKFLPEDPRKLLNEGKFTAVPTLLSHTTQEGLYTVAEFMTNNTALRELDQHWLDIAPIFLEYYDTACTKENRDSASIQIRTKYFGNARIAKETLPQLIRLESDWQFIAGVSDFAKALASAQGSKPVYLYQYGYRPQYSASIYWSLGSTLNYGVAHLDDMNLIMPRPYVPPLQTQSDKNMSRSLVDIWECFIRTGDPRTSNFPVWPQMPTSGDRLVYLNISGYNDGAVRTELEQGEASFWRSLPLLKSGYTSCNPIYGAT